MESHFEELPEINIRYTINMKKGKKISSPINHIVINKCDDESWIITCKKIINNDNYSLITRLDNKHKNMEDGENELDLELIKIKKDLEKEGITNPDDNFKIKIGTCDEHNDIGTNSVFCRIKYSTQVQWHLNLSIKTSDKAFNDTMIELTKDKDTNNSTRELSIEEHSKITVALREIGIDSPKQISELTNEIFEKYSFHNKNMLHIQLNAILWYTKLINIDLLSQLEKSSDATKLISKALKEAKKLLSTIKKINTSQLTYSRINKAEQDLKEIYSSSDKIEIFHPHITNETSIELEKILISFIQCVQYESHTEHEKTNTSGNDQWKKKLYLKIYLIYYYHTGQKPTLSSNDNRTSSDISYSSFLQFLDDILVFSSSALKLWKEKNTPKIKSLSIMIEDATRKIEICNILIKKHELEQLAEQKKLKENDDIELLDRINNIISLFTFIPGYSNQKF